MADERRSADRTGRSGIAVARWFTTPIAAIGAFLMVSCVLFAFGRSPIGLVGPSFGGPAAEAAAFGALVTTWVPAVVAPTRRPCVALLVAAVVNARFVLAPVAPTLLPREEHFERVCGAIVGALGGVLAPNRRS